MHLISKIHRNPIPKVLKQAQCSKIELNSAETYYFAVEFRDPRLLSKTHTHSKPNAVDLDVFWLWSVVPLVDDPRYSVLHFIPPQHVWARDDFGLDFVACFFLDLSR